MLEARKTRPSGRRTYHESRWLIAEFPVGCGRALEGCRGARSPPAYARRAVCAQGPTPPRPARLPGATVTDGAPDSPCPPSGPLLKWPPGEELRRRAARGPQGSVVSCQPSTAEPTPSTLRQRWFVLALLLFFVALSLQYTLKARSQPLGHPPLAASSSAARRSEDIYERFTYPNPPIMALLLEPLAHLPPLAGALSGSTSRSAWRCWRSGWVFRLVESAGPAVPALGQGADGPAQPAADHGRPDPRQRQPVHPVPGRRRPLRFRRGRDGPAGVLLALAIACKVTPALFVPYFLWKRAWKVLAGCAVGTGPVPRRSSRGRSWAGAEPASCWRAGRSRWSCPTSSTAR